MSTGTSIATLKAIDKSYAIWSTRQLSYLYPHFELTLHDAENGFVIHVQNCDESEFSKISEFFNHSVRPATCSVILSLDDVSIGSVVDHSQRYSSEIWLTDFPFNKTDLNNLVFMAEPNLPTGNIDFSHETKSWVFKSPNSLKEYEKNMVREAISRVGISSSIHFETRTAQDSGSEVQKKSKFRQESLKLITSRNLTTVSTSLKNLVERDEDEWRSFLQRRADQEVIEPETRNTSNFSCLYDVENGGDTKLSELLTLYDRVDVIPARNDLAWFSKHQISLQDLQELILLKRIRLVLPNSVGDYSSSLIDAAADVDPSSIILSRSLAIQTIVHGQRKEPLLYAPLSFRQRKAILQLISNASENERYSQLSSCYGEIFKRQHYAFMMQGALASLSCGVGAYLGDAFFKLQNKDARIEFAACGAGIEWALALGNAYIPRVFGDFDESWNSQIVASFLGGTNSIRSDPVENRIKTVTDGLLSVSGVAPIEVARNFNSLSASRFRKLAKRLMSASSDEEDLKHAVSLINEDVCHFERRSDRLRRWKVGALIGNGVKAIATDGSPSITFASILAEWLYSVCLNQKIPSSVREEVEDTLAMVTGLAVGASLDAVIVSRSRKKIRSK